MPLSFSHTYTLFSTATALDAGVLQHQSSLEPKSIGGKNPWHEWEKALKHRRFKELTRESLESTSSGWALLEAPMRSTATLDRTALEYGQLIGLTFREDTLSIPSAILKHQAELKIEELKEHKDHITRADKKMCRDAALIELKARTLPRQRFTRLLWDPTRDRLRVFTRSETTLDKVTQLFTQTFQIPCRRVTFSFLAHAGAGSTKLQAQLKGPLKVYPQ